MKSFLFLFLALSIAAYGRSFTTVFPATENPLSESWVCGQSAGGNQWGDIQTTTNFAYGVSQPTTYGDPTAVVTGTWGPNQTAWAIYHMTNTPSGSWQEAEVRLRTTITTGSISGYECYASVLSGNQYAHIASWGGPSGVWVNMTSRSDLYLQDGDTIMGTVTGTNPVTIKMYINGDSVLCATDDGNFVFSDENLYGPWTGGNPGIGFYNSTGLNWGYFGFEKFYATDGVSDMPVVNCRIGR